MVHEVSAGGVPMVDGKVYILKKKNGEWVMPKGHLEQGETAEEAALREVKEEAGIIAEIIGKVGETHYEFAVPTSKQLREKTVHWFLMKVTKRLGILEPVFDEVKLADLTTALDMLTFEAARGILKRAIEFRPRELEPD